MAQLGIQLDPERFCCSLCSKLLIDPVAIACGHSFCFTCINRHFNNEDNSGIYSCPQCRDIFMSRPSPIKNSMIALVVDQLRSNVVEMAPSVANDDRPEEAPPDVDVPAQPGDVPCDFCTETKMRAVKSCLQCLASYCLQHLQPHGDVAPLRKHQLVEATAHLEESICAEHQVVMKMFCRTDQRCICYICAEDGHKRHDKVSVSAARAEKQKELQANNQKILQLIKEKKKETSSFSKQEDAINQSAEEALASTESVFTELINNIEKKLSIVKESIQSRQNAEAGRFTKLRVKAEEELVELNRKRTELADLSQTEDHVHFLLNYPPPLQVGELKGQPTVKLRRPRNFDTITAAVTEARNKLLEVLDGEFENIMSAATVSPIYAQAPAVASTSRPKPKDPPAKDVQTQVDRGQSTADFVRTKVMQTVARPSFVHVDSSKVKFLDPSASLRVREGKTCVPSRKKIPFDRTASCMSLIDLKHDQQSTNPDVIKVPSNISDNRPDVVLSRVMYKSRSDIVRTRENLLHYARKVTLNPETANPHLSLTKENRKVVFVGEEINYPNNPERFVYSWQILSEESFLGRCYFEVERSGRGVLLALAYKDIPRSGTFNQCLFGQNDKSWAMDCFKNSYEFRHNNNKTPIPGTWSSRVGVFLDHSAGVLEFYSITDTMTLLHKVRTTFTKPLHVGLWLSEGASAEICKLA